MQKTLLIKLSIIMGLCVIFGVGLLMFRTVITERQYYADSVLAEITQQHVNPQEIITPFIAIPTTITPECLLDAANDSTQCKPAYSMIETVFATQTAAAQNLEVSTDTYQRGVYHAISYDGDVDFEQSYALSEITTNLNQPASTTNMVNDGIMPQQTTVHWDEAKLIIPVSDLRGVAILPTVTINDQPIKATYPQNPMIDSLSYVEVALPQQQLEQLKNPAYNESLDNNENLDSTVDNASTVADAANSPDTNTESFTINTVGSDTLAANIKPASAATHTVKIIINLPISGISSLRTIPTGQNFELSMQSNWHAPKFIGEALPNAKNFTSSGFNANWQNQYLTVANNQQLAQCLSSSNSTCALSTDDNSHLNSFAVSFAEPNDAYLQTERTMKYAVLLILVSFGTFFLFEVIKSSRIHPIQYLLVGSALLVFYVLLLPLAEQIAFWKAYASAASACVGLIGWYTYYVLGSIKRAVIFTAILAGLYAAFYGILTTEDLNLLLGAVFCFVLLASVMVMTRKIDWYQVA